MKEVPSGGQYVTRIPRDTDEFSAWEEALQTGKEKHVLGCLLANRTTILTDALTLQRQQHRCPNQIIDILLRGQWVAAIVAKNAVVLVGKRSLPLCHHGFQRFGK